MFYDKCRKDNGVQNNYKIYKEIEAQGLQNAIY